ncbi:MAG: HAMP domain-containing histidine kinase [Gammaproteobacteria bacterium]|nr:HAMP domain-containing histidine kinase [Gammaproteobacteria bacterium]MBU1414710.1 HAMP domain-containing histidine kinase [Gammaproteobacteria bacterium]
MARRHSLRFRVAAAFAGFGAAASLLLTAGIWFAARDVSQRLMDQTLKAELDDYMARRARNPRSLPPNTAGLRGYLLTAGEPATDVPEALRALPPGQHEIRMDGTPYRVAVAERGPEHYLILFSEERQKLREQHFLVYLIFGAGVMTMLSAIGGLWLAGRVIAPVTELAKTVSAAPPEAPPRLAAADEPADEIAELAGAFDQYVTRLAAFVERERAFAADASHELRTPLAVIRGAAELLADDARVAADQAARIDRIQRAAIDMSDLLAALLLLAREDAAPTDESCNAVQIVRDCIGRYQPLAETRGTAVEFDAPMPVELPVPAAMFAIVVANLVHNALVHTHQGTVAIGLDSEQLTVADTGIGIRDEEMAQVFQRYHRGPESSGAGIGLSLVKRVCDRYGWHVSLDSRPNGGTTAALRFHA